jgi:hypothetical protein
MSSVRLFEVTHTVHIVQRGRGPLPPGQLVVRCEALLNARCLAPEQLPGPCTLLTHGVAILPNADRGNLLLYLAQLFA